MTTHVITGCAMPMPKTTFAMLSDPGHGWLIVSPAWLEAFADAYPTAAIEDHLEGVAHLTSQA